MPNLFEIKRFTDSSKFLARSAALEGPYLRYLY